MEYTTLFVVEMLLLGIGVGILSAALGLGGGAIMVPAFLTFVPGIDAHTATGTSLFIIIFVAAANGIRLTRSWTTRPWTLVSSMALGSILGSYAGAYGASLLPEVYVVLALVGLGILLAIRTFLLKEISVDESDVRLRAWRAVAIGGLAGLAGGATGTGGGAVMVPLALWTGLVSNARATGVSNLFMVATAVAGSLANLRGESTFDAPWTIGFVHLPLVPLVFSGAQIGAFAGAWLNARMSFVVRRRALGMLLIVITTRLLARVIW